MPTGCPSGHFLNQSANKTGFCVPCTNKCGSGQYLVACDATMDSECKSCSKCSIGNYLQGCQADHDGRCVGCSNRFVEGNPCSATSVTLSIYTGPGDLDANNCPWVCADLYYKSNSVCLPCSTTQCNIGFYRNKCSASADGLCTLCTNLPDNALFVTAGSPFSADDCGWACNTGFYRDYSGHCSACMPASCNVGEILVQCNATADYKCQACTGKPDHSIYIAYGSCSTKCADGYFNSNNSCQACNYTIACPQNKRFVNCTSGYDSFCTGCPQSQEYLALTTVTCKNCSVRVCLEIGTYLEPCSPAQDAMCVSCTQAPPNSYYISPGSVGISDCLWNCTAGYQRNSITNVCLPCPAGSYSERGDSSCTLCPAGTYLLVPAAVLFSSCIHCTNGKYATIKGASSFSVCLDCSTGFYQERDGQVSCNACPIDYYGNTTGSTSISECIPCPPDTSTRRASGQAFETSCICNSPGFYRIDNKTVQCQQCPTGLICDGYGYIQSVLNGSQWIEIHINSNDFYRLVFCPAGYYYSLLGANILGRPEAIITILASQECIPCPAGRECSNPPCSQCSLCKPGHFKSCDGPELCIECLSNTFEPENGSLACTACDQGQTTNDLRGCVEKKQCVCDSNHYNFGQGCRTCPEGMTCFGNEIAMGVPLAYGQATWSIVNDTQFISPLYDLSFCPAGYFIQGLITTPEQLKCVPCPAGFECTQPPCIGSCAKCKKGFWKGSTLISSYFIPGYTFDNVSSSYVEPWIKDPCSACPVNTYRYLEGATELGSCTACPARSTTANVTGNSELSDCKCEQFYYQLQSVNSSSETSSFTCADCPQGCVCSSDRSCALASLGPDSMNVGNIQSNLQCNDPKDIIIGTWKRATTGEYRVIECPAGYTLTTSNVSATLDTCVVCPSGTYLLESVTSSSVTCSPCPIGAYCTGGNVVMALSGYWQLQSSSLRRGINDPSQSTEAQIFQCSVGFFCGSNNSCSNDRIGPVSPSDYKLPDLYFTTLARDQSC